MTWIVCRDATGHPAVAQIALSDDVVATFGEHERDLALELVEEMKRTRQGDAPSPPH